LWCLLLIVCVLIQDQKSKVMGVHKCVYIQSLYGGEINTIRMWGKSAFNNFINSISWRKIIQYTSIATFYLLGFIPLIFSLAFTFILYLLGDLLSSWCLSMLTDTWQALQDGNWHGLISGDCPLGFALLVSFFTIFRRKNAGRWSASRKQRLHLQKRWLININLWF
jgi:hypothetical protein